MNDLGSVSGGNEIIRKNTSLSYNVMFGHGSYAVSDNGGGDGSAGERFLTTHRVSYTGGICAEGKECQGEEKNSNNDKDINNGRKKGCDIANEAVTTTTCCDSDEDVPLPDFRRRKLVLK
eukprot:CAMPEP_0172508940 /NCGR_PEP_ID=MMETSP1066-20121228/216221_1 /TAXON_ID=671091 /ORGANISM="Coscinodiscus wailesii, Strain CCMP2513" /LENGTH=119 /DNA_ID=CAMNT_0013287181 /DNA_START=444 /DNA_END=803 /DNA_ORIENTATION=+